MGDIADMMLDGTLCCVCGCYLDPEVETGPIIDDIPNKCDDCKEEENQTPC